VFELDASVEHAKGVSLSPNYASYFLIWDSGKPSELILGAMKKKDRILTTDAGAIQGITAQ
jgi:hypothetical protein